jgi:PTH1 family peptidyl-tRNA hydrolase
MIRLIVFLGNKGTQYARTRHNSGWMFLDSFIEFPGAITWQEKFNALWTRTTVGKVPCIFLKPMTYMNESGKSVGAIARYFSLQPEEILIVHDDIEMPLKSAKLQFGGGLGGHNGLKSIKEALGTTDFVRLRIGVGRPVRGDVASYVLARFATMEEAVLPLLFDEVGNLLEQWFERGCPFDSLPIKFALPS